MKKKEGKYLKFYKECMNTGAMPEAGLCNSLCLSGKYTSDYDRVLPEELELIKPTYEELELIEDHSKIFWASESF